MRPSSSSLTTPGKFSWFLLITGIQAIPNHANNIDGFQRGIWSMDPRAEPNDGQDFQRNASSLASGPILFHDTETFMTTPIIVTLVLFLMFAASLIAVFFYGPEMRSFLQGLGRHDKEEPEVEESGLGFGFDGPTEAEAEALKWREEKATVKKSFWRHRAELPTRPSVVSPEESILPPVSLDDTKISLEDSNGSKVETHVDNEAQHASNEDLGSSERVKGDDAIHVVDR